MLGLNPSPDIIPDIGVLLNIDTWCRCSIAYTKPRTFLNKDCSTEPMFVDALWHTLREESSQTNIILQYKILASILSAVCSVIQQS